MPESLFLRVDFSQNPSGRQDVQLNDIAELAYPNMVLAQVCVQTDTNSSTTILHEVFVNSNIFQTSALSTVGSGTAASSLCIPLDPSQLTHTRWPHTIQASTTYIPQTVTIFLTDVYGNPLLTPAQIASGLKCPVQYIYLHFIYERR